MAPNPRRAVLIDAIARIAQKACRNGESGQRAWPKLYDLAFRESWRCVGEIYADEVLTALSAVGIAEQAPPGVWVRFWFQTGDAAGRSPPESSYEWFRERPSDACLEDEAKERVPSWAEDCRVTRGYEVLSELPEDVREAQEKKYRATLQNADFMLEVLKRS